MRTMIVPSSGYGWIWMEMKRVMVFCAEGTTRTVYCLSFKITKSADEGDDNDNEEPIASMTECIPPYWSVQSSTFSSFMEQSMG